MHRTMSALFAIFLLAAPSVAQEDQQLDKSKLPSKFDFHGYITQAYAVRESSTQQILGISEDGTYDYRNLALQASYAATKNDRFVLQLTNSRQGDAPFQEFMDDVEVDWAFYQHYFNELSLRVGRVPIPLGIYNEVRDVGALLPFYTPPFSLYHETQFAQETVDGVVAGKRFFTEAPWELNVEVYGGVWETTDDAGLTAKIRDALGTQLWLTTPVEGLRIGVGANQFDVTEGGRPAGVAHTWKSVLFSVDGDFQGFLARGEAYYRIAPFDVPFLGGRTDFKSFAYYLQFGYYLTPKLKVFAQYDSGNARTELPFLGKVEARFWEDAAISVHYEFLPQLLLKAEYHENRGFFRENTTEVRLAFIHSPYEGEYGIMSLSVSF